MDYEKVYDYLEKQEKPLSIGQINSFEEFKDVSRAELSEALRELAAENLVFRSLRDGKAYYSTNPAEGVSQNPCQKNIADLAGIMNQAFSRAGMSEKERNLNDAFRALGNLFAEFEDELPDNDEDEKDNGKIFVYNDGQEVEMSNCFVAIPDGFAVKKDIEDREFIAWYPADNESYNGADVVIYCGSNSGKNLAEANSDYINAHMIKNIAENVIWKLRASNFLLSRSDVLSIPIKGQVGGAGMYDTCNYHLHLGFSDCLQQFRIFINDARNVTDYFEEISDWVSRIRLKKEFTELDPLYSEEWLPLTQKGAEKWCNNFEAHINRHSGVYRTDVEKRIAMFENDDNDNSMLILKKDLRKIVKENLDALESCFLDALKMLESVPCDKDTVVYLNQMQEKVSESTGLLQFEINLGDECTIETSSEYTDEIETRLASIPALVEYKEEKKRIEAEKAAEEKAKKEAEEKARKEAQEAKLKYQETVKAYTEALKERENDIRRSIDMQKQNMREDLKAQYRAEKEKTIGQINRNIEMLKNQLNEKTRELSSLGFFKFSDKNRLKEEIASLNTKIKNTEAEIAAAESKYKSDVAKITGMLNKKEAEFRQVAERAYPEPVKPEKPQAVIDMEKAEKEKKAKKREMWRGEAEEVLEVLRKYGTLTIPEIKEHSAMLEDMSNQSVAAIVRQLKESGEIVRTEYDRKAYFSIAD